MLYLSVKTRPPPDALAPVGNGGLPAPNTIRAFAVSACREGLDFTPSGQVNPGAGDHETQRLALPGVAGCRVGPIGVVVNEGHRVVGPLRRGGNQHLSLTSPGLYEPFSGRRSLLTGQPEW